MDSVYLYNREVPISYDLWIGAVQAARLAEQALAGARRGHLGDPRPAAALHLLRADDLGRLRAGGPPGPRPRACPRPVERWRKLAAAAHRFVQESCWDPELQAYVMYPGSQLLDASRAGHAAGEVRRPDRPALPVHPGPDQRRAGLRQPGQPLRASTGRDGIAERRGHVQPVLVLVRRGAHPGRPGRARPG